MFILDRKTHLFIIWIILVKPVSQLVQVYMPPSFKQVNSLINLDFHRIGVDTRFNTINLMVNLINFEIYIIYKLIFKIFIIDE